MFTSSSHAGSCSALCFAVCWTSCWHYFSPFHKGVLTAARLCSLYTKCTAERLPFWPCGFPETSHLQLLPSLHGPRKDEGTNKVNSYSCGPQQRKHSACCPAADGIIQPIKGFLWLLLIAISFSVWCLTKFFLLKVSLFWGGKSKIYGCSWSSRDSFLDNHHLLWEALVCEEKRKDVDVEWRERDQCRFTDFKSNHSEERFT